MLQRSGELAERRVGDYPIARVLVLEEVAPTLDFAPVGFASIWVLGEEGVASCKRVQQNITLLDGNFRNEPSRQTVRRVDDVGLGCLCLSASPD